VAAVVVESAGPVAEATNSDLAQVEAELAVLDWVPE
jgi:hypothetical protein